MTSTVYVRIKCARNLAPSRIVSIFSQGVWRIFDDALGISYSRQISGLENDLDAGVNEVNSVISTLDLDFEDGKAVGLTMRSKFGSIFLSSTPRDNTVDLEFVLLCEIPEVDGRLDLNKVFDWIVSPFLMDRVFILDYVVGEDQPRMRSKP